MAHDESLVLAYSGHLEAAKNMSRRAAELAQQARQPDAAALYEIPPAVWQAFYGDGAAAKQSVTAPLALSRDLYVEYDAALALALAGDTARSRIIAADMQKRFGEDSSLRFSYIPTLQALYALNNGDPAKAIEVLQIAAPHELGVPRSAMHAAFGALYPVYVRGLVYLALKQGVPAAAEFQKILDHRGVVVSDPVGALAHLQIGRAYEMAGDHAKAKEAYSDFLTLWKHADAEIPILKQAQAEYAKLR
jgi:tetratricopeptide (TPR) repeat protein